MTPGLAHESPCGICTCAPEELCGLLPRLAWNSCCRAATLLPIARTKNCFLHRPRTCMPLLSAAAVMVQSSGKHAWCHSPQKTCTSWACQRLFADTAGCEQVPDSICSARCQSRTHLRCRCSIARHAAGCMHAQVPALGQRACTHLLEVHLDGLRGLRQSLVQLVHGVLQGQVLCLRCQRLG